MTKKPMLESHVPDEIWIRILEAGINNRTLIPKDVCSFSICSKEFNRLAKDDALWSTFMSLSFPISLNRHVPFSKKSLYQLTYEIFKMKALELLAAATEREVILQRRAILLRKIRAQRQQKLQWSRELEDQKQQIFKGRQEQQLLQQQMHVREEQLMLLRRDIADSNRELNELSRRRIMLGRSRRDIADSNREMNELWRRRIMLSRSRRR